MARPLTLNSLSVALFLSFALAARLLAEPSSFGREDWIVSIEPTQPTHWGTEWGIENFMLTYRILQRGKHEFETRVFRNGRFDSETGGARGTVLRFFSIAGDFGIFSGFQNLHHSMGHDAFARELARDYGLGNVPSRWNQVLPKPFGSTLENHERRNGGGADANTQYMVQPMQEENHFAYDQEKGILAQNEANVTELINYFFYRTRFYLDWLTETGTLNQDFLVFISTSRSSLSQSQINQFSGKTKFGTDFTNYAISLNKNRYGVQNISEFKFTMTNIHNAYWIQLVDPAMWLILWQLGKDYIGRGQNLTRIPMLPITKNLGYLPSLRVYISPFGIDYFADNFFRYREMLFNVYAQRGDDIYERRSGFGLDITNIRLGRGIVLELFGDFNNQPFLSRIVDQTSLSPQEIGRTHWVYNYGGALQAPLFFFGRTQDRANLFFYSRGGHKNDGWIPGAYLKGSAYVQVGLGLHL